jgi:hypothetical protein
MSMWSSCGSLLISLWSIVSYDSRNNDGDVVEVEVYKHWLEPAEMSVGHDFEGKDLFNHSSGEGGNCSQARPFSCSPPS